MTVVVPAGRHIVAGCLIFGASLFATGSKLQGEAMDPVSVARGHRTAAILVAAAEAQPPIEIRRHPLDDYLQSEWKLPSTYAREVVAAAFKAGRQHQVDPVLLLAIAAAESSFQHPVEPDKNFKPHKAYGIMQVIAKWHPEKFEDGKPRATTLEENFALGAQVFREALSWAQQDLPTALKRYNGWVSEQNGYARKVLDFRDRLRSAMAGRQAERPSKQKRDD